MNVQFLEFLSFIPTFYTRMLLDNLMNPIGIMFQESMSWEIRGWSQFTKVLIFLRIVNSIFVTVFHR